MTPQLVSRGTYTYLCNGEASGVEETWEIRQQGQERHIESVRYARPVGVTLRVRSVEQQGEFSRCMLHWHQQLSDHALEVSADYCFDPEGVAVFLHNGNEELEHREDGNNFLFSPLMRIYNGPIIEALSKRDAPSRVLVPWIKDPEQIDRLLHPDFSERRAQVVGETSLRVGSQELACREYDYSGGEYLPGTRFWIDENGVLLGYTWQQDKNTLWEIKLSNYESA